MDFDGVEFTPIRQWPAGKTLDGNGHTIRNIYTAQAVEITGLQNFGGSTYAWVVIGLVGDCEGTVTNLSMENCKFITEYTYTGGKYYTHFCGGGIAGVLFGGTISNCNVRNSTFDFSDVNGIRSFSDSAKYGKKGLCGFDFIYKNGVITNCEVTDCTFN